jgi:hypothetical protein
MSARPVIDLELVVDGIRAESETTCTWAGAHVLTVHTAIPGADLALELHSTFVGHSGVQTHVVHLTLGPPGHEATIITDPELGRALASIDQRARQPTLADRISRLRELRRQHASVNEAIAWGSKLDLADALWPTLLTKITRAEKHDRVDLIPIVRVLDRATQLANEFPRGSVVIPLKRASESS